MVVLHLRLHHDRRWGASERRLLTSALRDPLSEQLEATLVLNFVVAERLAAADHAVAQEATDEPVVEYVPGDVLVRTVLAWVVVRVSAVCVCAHDVYMGEECRE